MLPRLLKVLFLGGSGNRTKDILWRSQYWPEYVLGANSHKGLLPGEWLSLTPFLVSVKPQTFHLGMFTATQSRVDVSDTVASRCQREDWLSSTSKKLTLRFFPEPSAGSSFNICPSFLSALSFNSAEYRPPLYPL